MIQDKIIALCAVVFVAGLLPQVVRNFRTKTCGVALGTSLPTALALWVVAGCMLSLEFWFASGMHMLCAAMWTVILVQWFVYRTGMTECGTCRHRIPLWWRRAWACSITGVEHAKGFACGRFAEKGRDE